MNEKITKPFGNGKILVYTQNESIRSVHCLTGDPSPFCGIVCNERVFSESNFENGICSVELFSDNKIRKAIFTDYASLYEPVFVREFECYSELDFSLLLPVGYKASFAESVRFAGGKTDIVIIESKSRPEVVCICGEGSFSFDPDQKLKLGKGKGKIYIACGRLSDCFDGITNEIKKCSKQNVITFFSDYLKDIPKGFDKDSARLLRDCASFLRMQRKDDGLYVGSCVSPEFDFNLNCLCVSALCKLGKVKEARLTLDRLPNFKKEGDIYEPFPTVNNASIPSRTLSFALALLDVLQAENRAPSDEESEYIRFVRMYLDKENNGSSICFDEDDERIINGKIPGICVALGCAEKTVDYLTFAKRTDELFGKNFFGKTASVSEKLFENNFIRNGKISTVHYMKLKENKGLSAVYSFCPSCEEKGKGHFRKWLIKTPENDFVCPECYESGAEARNHTDLTTDHYFSSSLLSVINYDGIISDEEKRSLFAPIENDLLEYGFVFESDVSKNMRFFDLCDAIYASEKLKSRYTKKLLRYFVRMCGKMGIYEKYDRKSGGSGGCTGVGELSKALILLSDFSK